MNGLQQTLRNLGVMRLGAMAVVAAATIGFFIFITTRLAAPGYGLLYSNLDLRDSGQIAQKLDALSIPYKLGADGAEILVPTDQVARLRMMMADQGLPQGGSVGYEIFDKSESFGTSSLVENINQVRALEGELERTIATISLVQSARVHLVLPQHELFSREQDPPSASIVLKLRSVEHPTREQVAAIQHLVAAAVPDLKPNHVSIIDTDGNLLARGDGGDANAPMTSSGAEETRVAYENRLSRNVQELLERTVGPGKARVDVHVDMNFNHITTNSESYDPNGQVVRSTQTVNDSTDSSQGAPPPVSVSSNMPNGQTAAGATGSSNGRNRETHSQETVNYEISKTVRNQVEDAPVVSRLSVAVLVDGTYAVGPAGKRSYAPRSAAELQQLTALVRSAVGYDAKRGDTVEVENLRFAGIEEPTAAPLPQTIMGFERADVLRAGETLVMALIAVLVLLLVVRPMVNRLLEGAAAMPGGTAALTSALGGGALPALPAPAGSLPATAMRSIADAGDSIDIGQVDGRVAASSLRKVGEIVEKHPDEAVAIVRSWMYQNN